MDKSAIEQIQQTFTAQLLNDVLKTDGPAIVVPDNFKVVNLEMYAAFRNRFRGKMRTSSIPDFISYLSSYDQGEGQGSETYIDADNMAATCIHDLYIEGEPGHCDHTSKVTLEKTAAYRALCSIEQQRRVSQQDLSDYLEDWSNIITTSNSDDETVANSIAISAVRTITVARAREINSSIGNFENSASVIEKTEAKNKNNLPAFVHVTLNPYNDLKEQVITLRCSLLTSGDEPVFSLRIIKVEELNESLVNEFKKIIQDKVKPLNTDVYIGSFTS
jgi:uncharacterized protein YfdQ (DUF2303 family)